MSRRRSAKLGSYASFSSGESEPTQDEKDEIAARAAGCKAAALEAKRLENPKTPPSDGTSVWRVRYGTVRQGRMGITIG